MMKTISTLGLILTVLLAAAPGWSAEKWKMVWHDEFDKNGPPDPANWNYEQGFVRNKEPRGISRKMPTARTACS